MKPSIDEWMLHRACIGPGCRNVSLYEAALLVEAGVEFVRLREREDVVEDGVLVPEADLRADRNHQHVRKEGLVPLA